MTKMSVHTFTALLGMLMLSQSPAVRAATVRLADRDFAAADWAALILMDTTPGSTLVVTAGQAVSGGNPGAYRSLTQHSDSPVGTAVNLVSGHLFLGQAYQPAVAGAIRTVDVSFDGISIGSSAGAVAYAAFVRQDGRDFVAAGGQALNGAGWVALAFPALTADAFSAITSAGFDSALHPDFSASGAPVAFGFAALNGTFGDSTNVGGVDNWQVTIRGAQSVPLPGTAILLSGALLALCTRHRRTRLAG